MKRISTLLLSALLMFSFACSEKKSSEQNSTEIPVQEMQTTLDTPAVQTLPEQQPLTSTPVIQQTAPAPAITPAIKGSEALNPAHGQPGHDCSIAVGAPLSSAKAPGNQSIQMNSPAVNPAPAQGSPAINSAPVMATPNPASPGKTAPGMNPPHGEPGHDCAKPVGAPLK